MSSKDPFIILIFIEFIDFMNILCQGPFNAKIS